MALVDELTSKVKQIFKDGWTERDGKVIPESEDVGLGNDAIKLTGTVLYADLSASTKLVDGYKPHFAAEIYKAYLHCAATVIRNEGGEITAYDGDRIMAVFIGNAKNTSAARTALKINWCVREIVNPSLRDQYPDNSYIVRQTVGVDTSDLYIARTGIRGANDLVWVGKAANYAAKLTELSADYPSWITSRVYDNMDGSAKYSNGKSMWEAVTWTDMNSLRIYRSTWQWKP